MSNVALRLVSVLLPTLLLTTGASSQVAGHVDLSALKQKAQTGDAQAQTELGLAYRTNNPDAAAEWFRKAAEQGNPIAQNSLGVLYQSGHGVPKDFEQAFGWYKKAAAQKYGPGVFNVAISYYNGEGVSEDPVTAYAWMLLAQQLGEKEGKDAAERTAQEIGSRAAEGQLRLAKLLEEGKDVPKDEPGAAYWYKVAADGGSAEAQVKYGLMLADGRGGLRKDPEQAFQFMRRAADQKYGPAMFTVGYAYQKSTLGQQVDIKKAMNWYEGAAAAGHPGAMVNLGLMYTDGTAGPPNYKEAYFWLYMADAFNMPQAKNGIPTVKAHLSEKEIAGIEYSAAIWWQQKGRALLVRRRTAEETPNASPVQVNEQPRQSGDLPSGVYRVGGDVLPPKPIYDPDPTYDEVSRRRGISGTVTIRLIVAADGSTRDLQVVKSLTPELDQQAIEAVKTWKFSPATRNGEPVPVVLTTQCNFWIPR